MVRWWRLALLVLAGVVAAAAATVLAVAVNVATGGTAKWFPPVERHPLWWTAGATAAVAVASLLVWAAQRWYERGLSVLVPAVQRPEPWVVDRPAEVDQIVAALRRSAGTVGITTAVHGAGGFGKTTVAKMVRADRRVLRRFRGRVYWVTLGRDVGKQALAGLVNGLIGQVEPGRAATFTDARQAAEQLAAVLAAGPRRLVVLDDVWSEEQLAAFPVGGRCARLVTTRIPSLAKGASVPVKVDQMSETQARALLSAGLPPLPAAVAAGLLEETGRWPLLLRLVNKILADQAQLQPDIAAAAEDLLGRLRRGGALQVDQLTGAAGQQLDVSDPDQRQRAVRATIQASTSLLSAAEHDRFAELAVFAEDETIPVTLITALWQATGGLDRMATGALCARLADLALLTLVPGGDDGAVTVHDVIRDFLREELGSTRLAQLHQVLLDAAAQGLPTAAAAAPGGGMVTAWWELPETARYLREHLIEHLLAAGRADQAEEVAADLRWAGARLQASGPAGPYADLALIGTPRAKRLGRVLGQAAHLLAPTDPPHSLIDILYSRVSHDPDWAAQAEALTASRKPPSADQQVAAARPARSRTAPHPHRPRRPGDGGGDRPGRQLAGQRRRRRVGADLGPGHRPAARRPHRPRRPGDGGGDRPGRHLAGQRRRRRVGADLGPGHRPAARRPRRPRRPGDGGGDRPGRHLAGQRRRRRVGADLGPGHRPAARRPRRPRRRGDGGGDRPGRHLAGQRRRGRVGADLGPGHRPAARRPHRPRRPGDGGGDRPGRQLAGQRRRRRVGADLGPGHRPAARRPRRPRRPGDGGGDRPGRHLAGQRRRRRVGADLGPGHRPAARRPRPATAGRGERGGDRPGRHAGWPAAAATTGRCGSGTRPPASSAPPSPATPARWTAVAIAPDGTWLASGGGDGSVRIWDPATGQQRAALTGHAGPVTAVAIAPDGSWLASGGERRVGADLGPGHRPAARRPHRPRRPGDGGGDRPGRHLAGQRRRRTGSVRIWDPATGQQRADLAGHAGARWRRRWRSPRTAPGWPASATTGRCGSGTRPPVASAPSCESTVRLEDCAWSPSSQSLAAAGGAGLYHFTFKP